MFCALIDKTFLLVYRIVLILLRYVDLTYSFKEDLHKILIEIFFIYHYFYLPAVTCEIIIISH